jgi:hypothetical protein
MPMFNWTPIETKDAATILIALVAASVGLWQYISTSHDEFLKPVRENQLQLYVQASAAAASLATIPTDDPEWKKARERFLQLFYGPLAIVENYQHVVKAGEPREVTVERAMIAFKACLDDKTCVGTGEMLDLSLALAHTCRISIGSSWGFKAKQLEGTYQTLIEKYESH